tara:strand:- start:264 stop:413 length:150 start_codon:yes stop_codon:yes gene_type:complete
MSMKSVDFKYFLKGIRFIQLTVRAFLTLGFASNLGRENIQDTSLVHRDV